MRMNDLNRIKADSCSTVMVLANSQCSDPNDEDAGNIMRVISVKNFSPDVRVIVQLLQAHNKSYLVNIPNWNPLAGDEVLCYSELKMRFLAQSCLTAGASTLFTNMFSLRSQPRHLQSLNQEVWVGDYLYGAGMEIYCALMSPAFYNCTFKEAALLCYQRLDLILIALELKYRVREEWSGQLVCLHKLLIKPTSEQVRVQPGNHGIFICQSQSDAQRAFYFCRLCHAHVKSPASIRRCCKCKVGATTNITGANTASALPHAASRYVYLSDESSSSAFSSPPPPPPPPPAAAAATAATTATTAAADGLDSTGMFYWVEEARSLQQCKLHKNDTSSQAAHLHQHIVVCLFAEHDSPRIGLENFVRPLRASSIPRDQLKPIILIGNEAYMKAEWKAIKHFPDVYFCKGSPLVRRNLLLVNLHACSMCVVLSAKNNFGQFGDPYLVDKEVILCSLNIGSVLRRANTDERQYDYQKVQQLVLANSHFRRPVLNLQQQRRQRRMAQKLMKRQKRGG